VNADAGPGVRRWSAVDGEQQHSGTAVVAPDEIELAPSSGEDAGADGHSESPPRGSEERQSIGEFLHGVTSGAEELVAGLWRTDTATVRKWAGRLFSLLMVGACCGYVFWVVHPELILRNTLPTGGDMGAHVWGPAYLRDELLPHFRLTGWTPDWYAGFPAYTFYMVVPSLFIVALDVGVLPLWAFPVVAVLVAFAAMWAWRRWSNPIARFFSVGALCLGGVLLIDVPYGIAFKMVAAAGLVAFPAGAWWLGRGLGLRRPAPEIMAIASVFFLCCKSLFSIYGGNIASTMAGEFAFSLSITFSLFFLGTVARGLSNGRHRALAAGLLAITLLCHVIPFFFAVIGAVTLLALRPKVRSVLWLAPVGVAGGMMALFWYIPFYGFSTYLNDMGWEKLGRLKNACPVTNPNCTPTYREPWNAFVKYLLPFAPFNAKTPEISDPPVMTYGKIIFILAAVGLLLSLVLAVRAGVYLGLLAGLGALAFRFMPQGRFWNARVLPFYYLTIYLLAGLAIWLIIRAIVLVAVGRWTQPSLWIGAPVGFAALAVGFIAMGMSFRNLPGGVTSPAASDGKTTYTWLWFDTTEPQEVSRQWAAWNFSGYEMKGTRQADGTYSDWDEFKGMIDEMARIGRVDGCGRAMWEYTPDLKKYGTTMAPMLLPYFTKSCIGSMEGLYFEASSTTPFHFLMQNELSVTSSSAQRFDQLGMKNSPYVGFNMDLGIRHMQLLGVRYYMAYTDKAKDAATADSRLRRVGGSGPWEVFEVADSGLVVGLDHQPAVFRDVDDSIHSWAKPAVLWWMDPSRWTVMRASSGPASWPRVDAEAAEAPSHPTPVAKASNVVARRESISFDVDRVGTPVLVKVSYFPNWRVDGAEGPYRVAPNLMVVVPTAKHVSMTYGRSWLEHGSVVVSLAGFGLFLFLLGGWWFPGSTSPALAREWEAGEWLGDRDGRRRDPDEPESELDGPEPEPELDEPEPEPEPEPELDQPPDP